jgi:hypothetical protein
MSPPYHGQSQTQVWARIPGPSSLHEPRSGEAKDSTASPAVNRVRFSTDKPQFNCMIERSGKMVVTNPSEVERREALPGEIERRDEVPIETERQDETLTELKHQDEFLGEVQRQDELLVDLLRRVKVLYPEEMKDMVLEKPKEKTDVAAKWKRVLMSVVKSPEGRERARGGGAT